MSEIRVSTVKCTLSNIEKVGELCYRCSYKINPSDDFLGGSVILYLEDDRAAHELIVEVVGGAQYSLYHLDGSDVYALACSVSLSLVVPE